MSIKSVSFQMLLFSLIFFALSVDGDIVHIYGEPALSNFRAEDGVHHHLEGGGRVCESEEHYGWFE